MGYIVDMPFFMSDKAWYYFDGKRFQLTDKAPEEAIKSLEDFYRDEEYTLKGVEEGEQK